MIFLLLILFTISIEGMRSKHEHQSFNFAQTFPVAALQVSTIGAKACESIMGQDLLSVLEEHKQFVRPPQSINGNTVLHYMALNISRTPAEIYRTNLLLIFSHYCWDLYVKNEQRLSALQIAQEHSCDNSDFFVHCFVTAKKWKFLENLLDKPKSSNEDLENYLRELPFNAKSFQGFNVLQLLMKEYRWRRYSQSSLEKRLRIILPHVDPEDKGQDDLTPWQVAVRGWRTSNSENTDNLDEVVKQELLRHDLVMVLQSNKK